MYFILFVRYAIDWSLIGHFWLFFFFWLYLIQIYILLKAMTFDKKTIHIVGLMFLVAWLSFLFADGAFSVKLERWSLDLDPNSLAGQLDHKDDLDSSHWVASLPADKLLDPEIALPSISQQQSWLQDIHVLKSLYEKSSDSKVLVALIQSLASNYQFVDANTYMQTLMQQDNYEKLLDVRVILYITFHSPQLVLQDASSIDMISPLISRYRNQWLLTRNDELFYRWLISIWKQQYSDATAYWSSLTGSRYADIVQSYTKALSDYSWTTYAPSYYQDALISLAMLKNGYFSVAKRLALLALLQDGDYILPYQVLAYANFLSTNRDVSTQYFLQLLPLDKVHTDRYLFLVGISYYRQWDYEQTLLYLTQVTDKALFTDVYRYQLLSYIAMDDMENAIRIRQKILNQPDLQQSDFLLFFNVLFYQPYVNGQKFLLADANAPLVNFFMNVCSRVLSSGDSACVYGEVWQYLSTSTWAWLESKLLYLSRVYNYSYVWHVLGDYYSQNNEIDLARKSYLQSLALAPSAHEASLIKMKLEHLWSKK